MIKQILESISDALIAVIQGSLLVAGAAGAATLAYFVVMSCYRLIGSLRAHLFFPWP